MHTTTLHDAVACIPNGARLMIGGFMGVGTPEGLVDELLRQGKHDFTVIANDTAMPGVGVGKLVTAGAVRKVMASHIGLNPETQKKMLAGTMGVELIPQELIAYPRRGIRPRRHPHADRRPARSSSRASASSRSTDASSCSKPHSTPISPSCRPSSPTTSATSPTRLRRATSTR